MTPKISRRWAPAALTFGLAIGIACAGSRPDDLGLTEGRLAPCPSSPNCVSSGASDEEHAIEGFRFSSSPAEAWKVAGAAVARLPRTEIISQSENYLYAESTSALMRYVDDLELQLRAEEKVIAVRSASRIGHSDMGANRERVEALRKLLEGSGAFE